MHLHKNYYICIHKQQVMDFIYILFAFYVSITLVNLLIIVKENLINDYVSKQDMVEPQIPLTKALNPFYLIVKLFNY